MSLQQRLELVQRNRSSQNLSNQCLELPHAEGDDADGGGGHEAGEGGAGLGLIVGSHSR